MATTYELNLRDYWFIVVKRRAIIILSTLILFGFSTFFSYINKPEPLYEATASVKLEKFNNLAGLLLQNFSYDEYDSVSTQISVITSYGVIEEVARRLGKIDPKKSTEAIRADPEAMGTILALKGMVSAEQEGMSSIINISAVSASPIFAQQLAQTLAEVYRQQNLLDRNIQVIEAKRFIEKQLASIGDKLRKSEREVSRYQEENELLTQSSGGGNTVYEQRLADLQGETDTARRRQAELDLIYHELDRRLAEGDSHPLEGLVTIEISPLFDKLNGSLVELYMKHNGLLVHFMPDHPQVREIDQQIASILDSIHDEIKAQVMGGERKIKALTQETAQLRASYQAMPEKVLEFERLKRDVEITNNLFEMLQEKYQEILLREAEKVQEVSILRPALTPAVPINPPNIQGAMVAGLLIGLMLGLVFAMLLETLDTSIATVDEIESLLGVPVLGFIPQLTQDEARILLMGDRKRREGGEDKGELSVDELERAVRLITHFSPDSTLSESYRTLRTNIQFATIDQEKLVLMVSSSSAKEGKSTVAANLAVSMAQQGKQVLLVDGDLRKPMQHRTFGVEREPGLSDVILGSFEWREVVRTVTDLMTGEIGVEAIMRTPGLDNLSIITSGQIPHNPTDLINSQRFDHFLEEVHEAYDVVLFDVSPVLHTTDALILASKVNYVLLVYQVGSVVSSALRRTHTLLQHVNASLLGVSLNGVHSDISRDYAAYKMKNYYAYGYGRKEGKKPEGAMEKLWTDIGDTIEAGWSRVKRLFLRKE